MKSAELRKKTIDELQSILSDTHAEYFKHMLSARSNQLKETHLLSQTRRQVARVNTLLREKLHATAADTNASKADTSQ